MQPEDLSATEIDARLGASLDSTQGHRAFLPRFARSDDATIRSSRSLALGRCRPVTLPRPPLPTPPDWGTNRATALELIEDALNLRTPTIYDKERDASPTNMWSTRTRPKPRGKNSRKSRSGSRNGFGRTTSGGSGLLENTTTNSTMSGFAHFQRRPSDAARREPHSGFAPTPESAASGASCKRPTLCWAMSSARAKRTRWLPPRWS